MSATVISNAERLSGENLVGLTVGQLRAQLAGPMNIDPSATALLDGRTATDDTVVRDGQELVFSRPLGSKG